MAGLTEAEKQEILARRQGGGSSTPTSGGFSPFPGLELQSTTLGKTPSMRFVAPKVPQMTETERERTPMAQNSVALLDQFAKNLGITSPSKIEHPEKIAFPGVRELIPQKFQDYALPEESSKAYNDLESAFQLGAIVLTGRQGDIGKLQQLRDVYAFGGGIQDKPSLAYHRYQNLRRLFQTFDRAQGQSPEQRLKTLDHASQDMDRLLTEGTDPHVEALQQQFPGAKITKVK